MVFDASDGLKAKGGTGNQPDQDVSAAWNVKMKERNSGSSREGFPHRHITPATGGGAEAEKAE